MHIHKIGLYFCKFRKAMRFLKQNPYQAQTMHSKPHKSWYFLRDLHKFLTNFTTFEIYYLIIIMKIGGFTVAFGSSVGDRASPSYLWGRSQHMTEALLLDRVACHVAKHFLVLAALRYVQHRLQLIVVDDILSQHRNTTRTGGWVQIKRSPKPIADLLLPPKNPEIHCLLRYKSSGSTWYNWLFTMVYSQKTELGILYLTQHDWLKWLVHWGPSRETLVVNVGPENKQKSQGYRQVQNSKLTWVSVLTNLMMVPCIHSDILGTDGIFEAIVCEARHSEKAQQRQK